MGILVYRDSVRGSELVGRIDYGVGSSASFEYDRGFLAAARSRNEFGLSHRLPLDDVPYAIDEFGPFVRGLLPEGEVLGGLAELYQLPRNDYLSMIERLGCESIGALTLVSESFDPSEYNAHYVPLDEDVVCAAKDGPTRMAVRIASSTRLSLAGAQSKVAWFLPEGMDASHATLRDWMVPMGTAPSTHIVKLSRRGEEEIALNELVCSLLVESCDIEGVETVLVPGIPGAIAVRRYDREWFGGGEARRTLRRHQEDFCQAFGLPPFFKYQPEGVREEYLLRIGDLIEDASSQAGIDRLEFAKRLVFDYVVGNTDCHLKNSSLLYNRQWTARRLAPKYDVTCIPLTGYSTKMPYDIGAHRQLEEIDEADMLSVALDLDIALPDFDAAVREVIGGMESPRVAGLTPDGVEMLDRILENAKPRLDVLRAFAGLSC